MGTVAIVGCGASGMATAFQLSKLGFDVQVFEKENSIGGRMATAMLNDRSVCMGGKNIGKTYRQFRSFCSELGIDDFEDFGLNTSNGQGSMAKTFDREKLFKSALSYASGLSFKDIRRILPLILAVKKDRSNAYFSGKYFKKFTGEKYEHETLSSYFSPTLQRRLLRPLAVRNNGAEPDEIPIANFGTNIAMVLDSYEQLRQGPNELFRRFSQRIPVHTGKCVGDLWVENREVRGIIVDGDRQAFDTVVLATPAGVSSRIVANTHKQLSDCLAKVRYYPVGVVVAQYEKPVFDHTRRAWTFPDTSVLSNAGCYGKKDLDLVRYTFSGRRARQLLQEEPSTEKLVAIAEEEVRVHTSLSLSKRTASTGVIMQTGLCAYTVRHYALLNEIKTSLDGISGLFLAGDYLEGVSIEACFKSGIETAGNIARKYSTQII